MKCLESDYSYSGAKVHVVVYTSSEDICREVKDAESRGVAGVMEFLERHGGCYVKSEKPLVAESGDGSVSVEIKPMNFIARTFWASAVEKAREVCR
ncbi:MAG: hypothetical protein B7O98_08825 [Zestosphaera tikiterensis]|uniref:Uncharacterized protein n=1 Tax=Zestosphaera tikiterensis TaxID=1973259 RepID=A0A2R7Y2E0_9CREN|nr:MAG: hypothetical protein B7O98_08655 [Zestosphaera tikiterensis]PUA31716.1 MAG: hypothetical protein B7O98_08825 [Zestosphaera tikiterensis]